MTRTAPTTFDRVCVVAADGERIQRVRERLERMLSAAGFRLCSTPTSPQDLVISLGGDGTFLRAVHRYLDSGAAFLGINAGHLGFLQEAEEEGLVAAVDRLQHGRFRVAEVYPLEVEVRARADDGQGGPPRRHQALNDVLVERRDTRTLRLALRVDGHDLGPVVADGVLVCTPLGSTAYAFAAGGAVIHPDALVLQLMAVNPHRSRLARSLVAPLVVPDTATVIIDVDWSRAPSPRLVVDGEEAPLAAHQEVVVRRGRQPVRVVRFDLITFWERLQAKLG